MTTILLHGFWGQPRDWNAVLAKLPLNESVLTPDLYGPGPLAPGRGIQTWVEEFWRHMSDVSGSGPVQLVGYSMGGRLAVAAASAKPDRVARALFLSANPLQVETREREIWENEWQQKFLNLSWSEIEEEWEELPVFGQARAKLTRRQTPEMRELLGLSLKDWSPRFNPLSDEQLRHLPNRMEWAFGALDQKYLTIAKSLQELPVQGQISIIPEAGHRLVIEAADFVCNWIQNGR